MSLTNKKKLKIYVLSGFIFIIIVLFEIIFRIFTVFPINDTSNRVYNNNTGYTLSKKFLGIDENGYRNLNDYKNTSIIFIGDSHVYGNNVNVVRSFPYQYSLTEVYSMAAPSYGVFSYLYLSEKALSDGKDIVISILAENDFSKAHAHCFIDFENKYWKKTLQELEIPISDLACHENENYFLKKGIFYQLKENLKKIAIVSAFHTLTIERYKASKEASDDGYKKKRISLKYTNTNIRQRWYLDIYWPKILRKIKKLSKKYNKNVTILIIPSREDYTFKIKSKFPSELLDEFFFEKEKILFMENEIKKQGINYVSMNDVLNNMNRNIKYYGSHPYGDGYSAYAKALKQHFNKHKKK